MTYVQQLHQSQSDTRGALAQAMREVLSLHQVASLALDQLAPYFAGVDVGLALREDDDEGLAPVWGTGRPKVVERFLKRQGALWENTLATDRSGEALEGEDFYGRCIQVRQRKIGVLIAHGESQSHASLIDFIVIELGQVAAQVQEIDTVHRLSREMAILNNITKKLTSSLDLDSVLEATTQGLRELFNIERGTLALLDFDQGELLFRREITGETEWSIHYEHAEQKDYIETCLSTNQSILQNEISSNSAGSMGRSEESKSVLCVPLKVRDRVIGAIQLGNKLDGAFDAHDMDLLHTLATSAAAAIQNARLFHELTVANADLEASRWEIARSRSTLITLFDNLEDEIYIVNRAYGVIAVNRSRADRAGKDPRELVGRLCYSVLAGRDTPCPQCRVQETFSRGIKTTRTRREEIRNAQAEWEVYTYPILDTNGEVTQTINQWRDVTEQRRLEMSLIQAEKLAAVGQLAAGVAHELNNPLTAVIANTQLMQLNGASDPEDAESLDLIARAGKRAQEVVRDLLDFARQQRIEFDHVDVNETLQHSMNLITGQWHKHNVVVSTDLQADLPAVRGNADHLQTVWLNLLVNARDALGDAGGKIDVRSWAYDSQVVVSVSDDGEGIPQENLKKIFEPFFTTKDPGKGTGLGLSACYRIVKQHGGNIQVDSLPAEGTRVTVTLPCR
ncbi:MAG: GAF domain-containing protein [Anaerolineales bacterium]|nr:GAF domain-containing protein [Anaerolineales bacterium]